MSTQLRCITRPGVPASYLAPGVVFVCVHLRSVVLCMHFLLVHIHRVWACVCFGLAPLLASQVWPFERRHVYEIYIYMFHIGLYHGLVCMYPFSTLPTRSKCLVQHASFTHSCLFIQPPVSMLNCFLANTQTILLSIVLKDILGLNYQPSN